MLSVISKEEQLAGVTLEIDTLLLPHIVGLKLSVVLSVKFLDWLEASIPPRCRSERTAGKGDTDVLPHEKLGKDSLTCCLPGRASTLMPCSTTLCRLMRCFFRLYLIAVLWSQYGHLKGFSPV